MSNVSELNVCRICITYLFCICDCSNWEVNHPNLALDHIELQELKKRRGIYGEENE